MLWTLVSCVQEKFYGLVVLKELYPLIGWMIGVSDSEKTRIQQQGNVSSSEPVAKSTGVHYSSLFCTIPSYS